MRVPVLLRVGFGLLLIGVCGFAAWRSIWIANADWAASKATVQGFDQAMRLMPDEPELLARAVLYRNDNDEQTAGLDADLERAARLNPLNSQLMMTIGLRAEFRGDQVKAEEWLTRAAQIDHQFKPAWTLANYYFRTNQPKKSWPMIKRILNLEPLGFDPGPVFALCWDLAPKKDANTRVLEAMPKTGHRPVQYLDFLTASKRTDTALALWPRALAAADRANADETATLTRFADYLGRADRVSDSVNIWNQLVDRGIIHSGRVDPAKGASIANPDFRFVPENGAPPGAFGWNVADIPGIYTTRLPGLTRFEINGDEPPSFTVLSVFAPVLPGKHYRLQWKTESSGLNEPRDPGFRFRVVQEAYDLTTECPALLGPAGSAGCEFETPALGDMKRARIELGYARALGTTRISGELELLDVHLELPK